MRLNTFFSFPILFLLFVSLYLTVDSKNTQIKNDSVIQFSTVAENPTASHVQPESPAGQIEELIPVISAQDDPRIFSVARVLRKRQNQWPLKETWSLAEHIVQEADSIGVSSSLLLAVIEVESNFDPCAVSPVGAKGLMQVMPTRILGPEKANNDFAFNHHLVYDPHWNISFGAAYLHELIARFGSVEMALSAYNRGPTRLSRQLRNQTFNGCGYTRKVFAIQEALEQHTI